MPFVEGQLCINISFYRCLTGCKCYRLFCSQLLRCTMMETRSIIMDLKRKVGETKDSKNMMEFSASTYYKIARTVGRR